MSNPVVASHIADTAFRLALATDFVGADPTPAQVRAFAREAGCAPDILAACLGRRYGNLGGRPHARRVVGPFHPSRNAHLIPVSDRAQAILDDFWRVPCPGLFRATSEHEAAFKGLSDIPDDFVKSCGYEPVHVATNRDKETRRT